MHSELVIAIDSREKRPYKFESLSKVVSLKTGDYSIVGFENIIAIERKSKADLFMSFGKNRERFERECKRLSEIRYAGIVVESTWGNLSRPPRYSKMNPLAVKNSLISWSLKYNLHVWMAGDRKGGEEIVENLLKMFLVRMNVEKAREYEREKISMVSSVC